MRGDELQTFKNVNSASRENLTEIATLFRRKYVKSQSMAMAKHKFHGLVYLPANQELIDFLDKLQNFAKNTFRFAAQRSLNNSDKPKCLTPEKVIKPGVLEEQLV